MSFGHRHKQACLPHIADHVVCRIIRPITCPEVRSHACSFTVVAWSLCAGAMLQTRSLHGSALHVYNFGEVDQYIFRRRAICTGKWSSTQKPGKQRNAKEVSDETHIEFSVCSFLSEAVPDSLHIKSYPPGGTAGGTTTRHSTHCYIRSSSDTAQ